MKMKMMTAVGLTLAAFCAAPHANAAPVLGLEAVEAGFSPLVTTGPNALILNGPVGTFLVNLDTASLVQNPLGFLTTANDVSSPVGGTLVVTGSAQNLTNPAGAASFLSQFSGTFIGSVSNVELQTYYNSSNTLFGTETLLADLFNGPTSPFATSDANALTTTTPFSVTEVMTIRLTGSGQVGLSGQIDGQSCIPGTPGCVVNPPVLPEPSSMMLLGSGLLGLAAVIRRRKRQS